MLSVCGVGLLCRGLSSRRSSCLDNNGSSLLRSKHKSQSLLTQSMLFVSLRNFLSGIAASVLSVLERNWLLNGEFMYCVEQPVSAVLETSVPGMVLFGPL